MSKTALFASAKAWDAKALRVLLSSSPELALARDAKGRNALHVCAGAPAQAKPEVGSASIDTARVLLKAGVDINGVHEIADDDEVFSATALWYALARGRNEELARFLLKVGANPDHCLWTVIWSNEPKLVRLLLKAGSKVNARAHRETPLIYAARLGRERIILDLVRAGADVAARDAKGLTAAAHARRRKLSKEILHALGETAGAVPSSRRSSAAAHGER